MLLVRFPLPRSLSLLMRSLSVMTVGSAVTATAMAEVTGTSTEVVRHNDRFALEHWFGRDWSKSFQSLEGVSISRACLCRLCLA